MCCYINNNLNIYEINDLLIKMLQQSSGQIVKILDLFKNY